MGARNGFIIVVGLVGRIGGHDHGFAGPLGIGVLALDFIEKQDRAIIVALVEFQGGLIVQLLHWTLDIGEFLFAFIGRLAPGNGNNTGQDQEAWAEFQKGHAGQELSAVNVYSLISLNRAGFPRMIVRPTVMNWRYGLMFQTAARARSVLWTRVSTSDSQRQADGVARSLRTNALFSAWPGWTAS